MANWIVYVTYWFDDYNTQRVAAGYSTSGQYTHKYVLPRDCSPRQAAIKAVNAMLKTDGNTAHVEVDVYEEEYSHHYEALPDNPSWAVEAKAA